jgi:hypothetical protein
MLATEKATARVTSTGGAAVSIGAGGSFTREQHITPDGQSQGPAHGVVRGDVWRKRVQGSKHMLRVPRPAWAVDAADLDAAERVGAVVLELTDAETGTTYRAALRTLRERGRYLERGYGAQVCLDLEHWRSEQPGAARQLALFGGAL